MFFGGKLRGWLFLTLITRMTSTTSTSTISSSNNIIIIGGGAAGLTSAIEASKNKENQIYLLEKMTKVGGNSAKASSGINGAMTQIQTLQNIPDSYELFKYDTLQIANNLSNIDLVDKLVTQSTDAIQFLTDLGLPLEKLIQLGGHSIPRTHRLSSKAPIGWSLISTLQAYTTKIENIHILTSAIADHIIVETTATNEKIIKGIEYHLTTSPNEALFLSANSIIIAAGGSAYDQTEEGLLSEFTPHLRGMATSSGSQADGSGIKLAREIGAELINMDQVQIHPSGFIDPKSPSSISKILAPEALRGSGGILINSQGERFANELGSRAYLANAIQRHCSPHQELLESQRPQPVAFLILNKKACESFGLDAISFYLQRGLMKEYSNIQEVAVSNGFSSEKLLQTIEQYNEASRLGIDMFQKKSFPIEFIDPEDKLFIAQVTPVIHYTLGGIKIDDKARVLLKETHEPIRNLYAAGESTGGVHGADRLGGNSLLECVVFGRIAGREASKTLESKYLQVNDEL